MYLLLKTLKDELFDSFLAELYEGAAQGEAPRSNSVLL